ncbi:MAG: hypothetical protein IKJ18_01220 [Bacteroidaceae bacterium]|nr:hypothetical protein [Bacteroidaceae bacterium]
MLKKYAFLALVVAMTTVSCVEDEGNNIISDINEIELSGLEESYYCVTGEDVLTITPEIKCSFSDTDESNLEYEWFLCNNGIDKNHVHEVIGRERDLSYPVTAAPASYLLYFSVKDKTTGLKWETSANFKIISPFVRGFYLFGDKEDGSVGLDFVSMIENRDTFVVEDILNNDLGLEGAENFLFTGHYSELTIGLWALTESGNYKVEYGSALSEFNFMPEKSDPEKLFFPTIPTTKPYNIVEMYPHAYGSANVDVSKSTRFILTDNEIFCGSITTGEAYGNPINRFSATATEFYKPSKYVFYKPSTYISYFVFYDEDSNCFTRMNGATYALTYTPKLTNEGTPFYWDQTQYEATRSLVYGENGVGNAGRSYALMKDTNGDYFVYLFTVGHYSPSMITANAERAIDLSVATDFSDADHYAFYSMQQILLYAAGTKLYAYDYARNECKLVKDFEAEITHLAMDFNSNDDTNHFIVATYDDVEKGVVYGYTIEDNQNEINVTPVEEEEWHTDLKVVKVEYRNSTF